MLEKKQKCEQTWKKRQKSLVEMCVPNFSEKQEEDKNADRAALAIYEEQFESASGSKKLLMKPKPFVKGGTYDITKKMTEVTGSGTLYIP